MKKIAIAGAGFSGAVIAHELAKTNKYQITVYDDREHVAGNCHTQRDKETGIMVHVYGPHIFHTSNEKVWNYVNSFDKFMPFTNRVKAHAKNRVFSMPINLLTINTLFNKQFSPEQAKKFIETLADLSIEEPDTFEEQALKFVGNEIYETFFKGYTIKQWGLHPSQLPASILKRLPVRFNYDDNYYSSKFQGIPLNGYSYIIEKMLDHKNITVKLKTPFHRDMKSDYDHIFYSGPIDAWFEHSEGRLGYRTLKFETEIHDGDYQGNPVINYCDQDISYTRISEHKHFAPWEEHKKTLIYKEYSALCGQYDIPYYPIRLTNDKTQLEKYVKLAMKEKNITFVGRLATYRYIDMHVTIAEALDAADKFLKLNDNDEMPIFNVEVL